jgi:site-specific recombinase XerD
VQKQRFTRRDLQSALDTLSANELEQQLASWLLDGEVRQLSKNTIANRRVFADRLLWFVRQRELAQFGPFEARSFMAYLNNAHESDAGRWGDPDRKQPLRPASAKFYHKWLHAFGNFFVEEGVLDCSPTERLKPPIVRQDVIQPFTREQRTALRAAARKSRHPKRDEVIVLFLLDTGCRASELCSIRKKDLDLTSRRCRIRGKGEKDRVICFGATTTKALWSYMQAEPRDDDAPLFLSDRGPQTGEPLTRSGLRQLTERLAKAAKVESCRCSPHVFRHTFALTFLKQGGNMFSLQMLLGHTDLDMTRRYVSLAQADIESQHRQFSPVDSLGRKR